MERIKVKEAASILGVSEQYIRIGMQRGWLPIGSCVKMSSKWTYHISPHLLNMYLGKSTAATVKELVDEKKPPAATDGNRHYGVAERTW